MGAFAESGYRRMRGRKKKKRKKTATKIPHYLPPLVPKSRGKGESEGRFTTTSGRKERPSKEFPNRASAHAKGRGGKRASFFPPRRIGEEEKSLQGRCSDF